jgi:KDO2-lipid IV(A) lauroyltransferase
MRYNISVTMARVIRKNKYQFSLDINEPIIYSNIAKEKKGLDIIKFSAIINQTLEKWISQYPSQWFWVHDRWKK